MNGEAPTADTEIGGEKLPIVVATCWCRHIITDMTAKTFTLEIQYYGQRRTSGYKMIAHVLGKRWHLRGADEAQFSYSSDPMPPNTSQMKDCRPGKDKKKIK